MTKEEHLKAIKDAETAIELAQQEKQKAVEAFIEEHHPHKVGDVVTVNGYTHTGKQMQIERVSYSISFFRGGFRATGKVIKKDGTLSKQRGEWYENP